MAFCMLFKIERFLVGLGTIRLDSIGLGPGQVSTIRGAKQFAKQGRVLNVVP